MEYRLLPLAAAMLAMLPGAAGAACVYKPFEFHPEKNDGVVVEAIVDAGSRCVHQFGEGTGYKFTGLTLEREPEHGKLTKVGPYWFFYVPDKGFTGKDAYIFKICARKGGQSGCSTVAFVATVK